ncbi:MAG: ethylbenzene dehydrogenase-related protein [Betaproteobacteria bacterium]|nr:ethylbenzene dehydrogenase-related protein [Gammaproteobacteria bacterium]MDH3436622.1 ethylbenzene dehydrogenase-related protein [Betaproteobacteria bacterium]
MKRSNLVLIAAGVGALFPGYVLGKDPAQVDWNSVPTQTLTLFWPAQSSFQWLRSAEHPGAGMVKAGGACLTCHKGAEEKLGNKLVKANKLEPMPVKGKNGVIKLGLQIAYDDQNAYFRAQWNTRNPYPGEAHPFERFDGKKWEHYGYPKLDKVVQDGKQPGIYEDRFSIMIDDGSVPGFANQGCWLTCHNGERDMPNKPSKAVVQGNPLFKAIKKSDVRKYLPATRTDAMASWDKAKSMEEIKKLKADGALLDLMQWRGHRSNPVGMADDFHVLEYRNGDAGKNPFSSNVDKKKHQPKYMYDEKKVGKKALREEDIRKGATALIREQNAVPFDPNAGWKEGDLIPAYVVSRAGAKGSAADNKQAKGTWKDGMWTVVWARPRNLTNSDDKMLKEGKVYNFAFAVHDDNITTRGHQVSFPVTVGFGAKAAIEVTKLK